MPIENNLKTEGIAQIAAEETHLNLAVGRVMLAVAAVAIFVGGLYLIINDPARKIEGQFGFGLLLLAMSMFPLFGAWRTHVVRNKLKTLSNSENSDPQS